VYESLGEYSAADLAELPAQRAHTRSGCARRPTCGVEMLAWLPGGVRKA